MISDTIRPTAVPKPSSLIDGIDSALRLRFRGGQRNGQTVRISARKCTIGSSPECTLRLVCPGVQAVHCLIICGQGGMAIRRWSVDTFLNGKSFTDAPLLPGDRLTVGPVEFDVLPAVATASPTRSARLTQEPPWSGHMDHAVHRIADLELRIQQRRSETDALLTELRSLSHEVEGARLQQQLTPAVAQPADRYREELNELAAQIESQRSDYQRDRASWLEQCQQIASSLDAVRQLQASAQQSDSSEDVDQRFRDLLEREQQLRHQQEELEHARGEFDHRVREWEAECEHSREHLERARAELDHDRTSWQSHMQEAQAEMDQRARELEAASQALSGEQASFGEWRSQQEAAQEARQQQLEEELAGLKAQLERVEEQKQRLLNDHDELRKQLDNQPEDCQHELKQQWEDERSALQSQLEAKQTELCELRSQWESERCDVEQAVAAREQEIQQKWEALRLEQQQLEQARADWESAKQSKADEDRASAEGAFEEEKAAFLEQRDAWDAERQRLDAELNQRQAELDEQFKQLQHQEQVLAAGREELDNADVPGLQAKVDEFSAERDRLLAAVDESESIRAELQGRLQQLEQEQQHHVAAVEASETQREELRLAVEEGESTRQELQARLNELEASQQATDEKTGDGHGHPEAEESESIRQELQTRLDELEAVQRQQAEAAEANEAQRQELDARMETLHLEQQQARQEIEEARQQLAEERRSFEEEMATVQRSPVEPSFEDQADESSGSEFDIEQQFAESDAQDQGVAAEIPSANQTMAIDMLEQLRAEAARGQLDEPVENPDPTLVLPTEDLANKHAEEEVTFATPVDEPPVDTAAILAKFGQAEEVMESPPTFAPTPQPDGQGGEGNDDINNYMTQLMQRVGGAAYQAPQTEQQLQAAAAAADVPRPSRPTAPSIDTTPLDPSEFVPRAVAPEASSNLKDLREVANSSARSAIDKHQRKRLDHLSMVFGFIAIVTLMVGATVAYWARSVFSVPALIAALSMLGCLASGLTALRYASKAKSRGESTDVPNEGQAAPVTAAQVRPATSTPELSLQDTALGTFEVSQEAELPVSQ